ncbi:formate dehydrogenase accessory protein [Hydrogenobacter thermophilus TK-6]|uniref:Formate dehydrogenase formation protein FdhE n=1 Tax=Hydrogenobacter thermophilus (strain DSM 6534 / IAM 12695 / TK-6) TaxID=608538 RepID=D3DHU0_HYDTT|nr:formate dehydrogenase accessory protein FdhE [Hydrogenobacter thermophilus]ADO45325.1 formate dehydrogenase accessory protein [Hydrogenobacter thermophilus TK-6]BAI69392.1 formate dehydrogenase formation protein FdhE [Hydrogenobacter thermophilus TK-6]
MSLIKLREREYHLERLIVLKKRHPEVSHVLDFLHSTMSFQKEVYERLKDCDWKGHIKKIYQLLDICRDYGSPLIQEKVQELRKLDKEALIRKVDSFLKDKDAPDEERFIFLTFLNPFFSKGSEEMDIKKDQWLKNRCPVCGFKPCVSYIADGEDVEGARYLVCVLCNTEWLYNRTQCVRCGNNEDNTLEYYYDQGESYAILQVCKKCDTYMKVIDMRKDGLAVPHLDDIATLSLDLWAKERGFLKFERNIIGL